MIKEYAYELGKISAIESAAIGCNWSFATSSRL